MADPSVITELRFKGNQKPEKQHRLVVLVATCGFRFGDRLTAQKVDTKSVHPQLAGVAMWLLFGVLLSAFRRLPVRTPARPLFVRRPPFAVRRPLFAVRRPPSAVRCPPSAARRPPSAVRRVPHSPPAPEVASHGNDA